MTADRLAAIRARLEAATQAVSLDVVMPTLIRTPDGDHEIEQVWRKDRVTQMATVWGSEPYAVLLVHAHSDIGWLLARVQRLEEVARALDEGGAEYMEHEHRGHTGANGCPVAAVVEAWKALRAALEDSEP